MNILKSASISAVICFTLTFAGCNINTPNSNNLASHNSTDISTSSKDTTTSSENEKPSDDSALTIIKSNTNTPEGTRTNITGLDGNPIYTSEFTTYTDKEGQSAEYSEGNLGTAICEGFAYISKPDNLCRNSIDNADIFDADFLSFSGITEEKLQDYVRINTGDKVNGLTVLNAQSIFRDDGNGLPNGAVGKYFVGSECTFLGELELNGYACAIKEDEYGVQAGDILFVPQGECPLPVMSFKSDPEIGIYHTYYTGNNYGMTWANQYGQIFLGNTQTTDADVSCLPADGSFVKIKAVVKGIKMTSSADWFDIMQASIVTIERE